MAKRAVIYYRVSTTDQDINGQAAESREYADHRGSKVVEEYVNTTSGAAGSAHGLIKCLTGWGTGV